MGRRRNCGEERSLGLDGLEMLIKAGENRDIQRQSLTNLRAIAGLIVVELLGLGLDRAKYFYHSEGGAAIYGDYGRINVQADVNPGGLPNSPRSGQPQGLPIGN